MLPGLLRPSGPQKIRSRNVAILKGFPGHLLDWPSVIRLHAPLPDDRLAGEFVGSVPDGLGDVPPIKLCKADLLLQDEEPRLRRLVYGSLLDVCHGSKLGVARSDGKSYLSGNDSHGGHMREFDTGATRDTEEGKLDYEGFLSPLVLRRFAEYMHAHRVQADGNLRDSDNWQKGMPKEAYIKSGFRHFMDWWMEHRGHDGREDIEEALCALLFNVQGYLHEHLKESFDVGPIMFDESDLWQPSEEPSVSRPASLITILMAEADAMEEEDTANSSAFVRRLRRLASDLSVQRELDQERSS